MVPDRRQFQAMAVSAAAGAAALAGAWATGQPLAWSLLPAIMAGITSYAFAPPEPALQNNRTVSIAARGQPDRQLLTNMVEEAIDSFALPLIITGADGGIIAASGPARKLFAGLAKGRPVSLAIRDPDFLEALQQETTAGRTITLTWSTPANRAMRVHITSVTDPDVQRQISISVFEDLTEQLATERLRVDFIANASHELRTPLASLLGFVETLQGPARDDPKARERFLAIMREQANRMARLIDDLLSLSRAELRAHQQPTALVDLTSIVREIIDSLSLSARERGVVLQSELPEHPLMIRGDRDDLLRLVENLVENAVRYGRDGKLVCISLKPMAAGMVGLGVRDHGPGIAPEHLPRLTERFYRADVSHSREMGGTGLGLAIVKHLVARHGARLEIDSAPGNGATFTVQFPAADSWGAGD